MNNDDTLLSDVPLWLLVVVALGLAVAILTTTGCAARGVHPPRVVQIYRENQVQQWEIRRWPEMSEEANVGETFFESRLIQVEQDHSLPVEREIVLHELNHACLGISLPAPDPRDDTENVVGRMTPCLLQTLEHNPKLRRYLFGK